MVLGGVVRPMPNHYTAKTMRGLSPNWLLGTETLHLYIRRRCASLQIDIEIDPAVEDTKVLIMTKEKNQFINDLIDVLSNYSKKKITSLTAYINDKVYFIDVAEILRIYTANQKVYTDKRGGIPNKI